MGKIRHRIAQAIEFIFFGNYFYALCAVSLSIESSLQQSIGLNRLTFYLLLATATIVYYTYAYTGEISFSDVFSKKRIQISHKYHREFYNRRTSWYKRNANLLNRTQVINLIIALICSIDLAFLEYRHIFTLYFSEWLILFSVPLMALLYYGNSYFPFFKINLRQTGWLKPFVIGFVWAGTVTLYPSMFHQWQMDLHYHFNWLSFWFLLKNWMYISVLAIMFDIKDYVDDANKDIKTFVVRVGLRKTIFLVLLPLIIIGLVAFFVFAYLAVFSLIRFMVNLIPFILLLWVAYSMQRRKSIFYYLIIIDGLMLVKGICGIVGALLFK